jgi:integrase
MTSVTVTKKANGRWEVRWRNPNGRRRGRTLDRRDDAVAFADVVRRRLQTGGLVDLRREQITLGEFMEEWWERYAIVNLRPATLRSYKQHWGKHIEPRLGAMTLREITPEVVDDFREQLHRHGVGDPTVIKTLGLLQGMFKRALAWGRVDSNPARDAAKPRQHQRRAPEPLTPAQVEAVRDQLGQLDATLVAVMAYAGLRPDEAIRLRWRDVSVAPRGALRSKLHVRSRKTGRDRWVNLLGPLAVDLAAWRLASGRPTGDQLVFPRPTRQDWTLSAWRNWVRRRYQPAAQEAGITGDMRAYRLRVSFVSLLLYEGRSVTYVADQAGHTVQTLSDHYAGVLAELEDADRVSAEQAIRQARQERQNRRAVQ